jgi:hypothetical protein
MKHLNRGMMARRGGGVHPETEDSAKAESVAKDQAAAYAEPRGTKQAPRSGEISSAFAKPGYEEVQ